MTEEFCVSGARLRVDVLHSRTGVKPCNYDVCEPSAFAFKSFFRLSGGTSSSAARTGTPTVFAPFMAVNVIPCPTAWPGEEQLLDQNAPLNAPELASTPCSQARDEQLISTRPPRSKSKGDLVIVINEKLRNSK